MADDELTHDAFLGGRVRAWQPARGFRAGLDSVFLAAAVPARGDQSVLELGIGPGVASLCLAARVPGVRITGVERNPVYADLAKRNLREAGLSAEVVVADLAALPGSVTGHGFDHVMLNPPYFDRRHGLAAVDPGREAAFGTETPLAVWMDVAARSLRDRGYLTLIQRIERLPEVLMACDRRLGSLRILPLQARAGRPPDRFLLQARKRGRAPFRLLAPFRIHAAATHLKDAPDFTEAAEGILQKGCALPLAD